MQSLHIESIATSCPFYPPEWRPFFNLRTRDHRLLGVYDHPIRGIVGLDDSNSSTRVWRAHRDHLRRGNYRSNPYSANQHPEFEMYFHNYASRPGVVPPIIPPGYNYSVLAPSLMLGNNIMLGTAPLTVGDDIDAAVRTVVNSFADFIEPLPLLAPYSSIDPAAIADNLAENEIAARADQYHNSRLTSRIPQITLVAKGVRPLNALLEGDTFYQRGAVLDARRTVGRDPLDDSRGSVFDVVAPDGTIYYAPDDNPMGAILGAGKTWGDDDVIAGSLLNVRRTLDNDALGNNTQLLARRTLEGSLLAAETPATLGVPQAKYDELRDENETLIQSLLAARKRYIETGTIADADRDLFEPIEKTTAVPHVEPVPEARASRLDQAEFLIKRLRSFSTSRAEAENELDKKTTELAKIEEDVTRLGNDRRNLEKIRRTYFDIAKKADELYATQNAAFKAEEAALNQRAVDNEGEKDKTKQNAEEASIKQEREAVATRRKQALQTRDRAVVTSNNAGTALKDVIKQEADLITKKTGVAREIITLRSRGMQQTGIVQRTKVPVHEKAARDLRILEARGGGGTVEFATKVDTLLQALRTEVGEIEAEARSAARTGLARTYLPLGARVDEAAFERAVDCARRDCGGDAEVHFSTRRATPRACRRRYT
jgi:hypothetical protein